MLMVPHKIEQDHPGRQIGANVFIIENEFDQRPNGFFKVNENRAKSNRVIVNYFNKFRSG
jgi:hypothetical protein